MSEYTIRLEPGHVAVEKPGAALWVTHQGIARLKDVARGESVGGGEPGPAGPQGEPGPVGPAGPKGDTGEIGPPGNDGADGADGAPGADGLSAYQVALANGFVGSALDFLDSLVGPQGPAGQDGAPGADGQDGAPGTTDWNDITNKPATFAPIIGGGAAQACAGNDARLSDARTPTQHAYSSHSGLPTLPLMGANATPATTGAQTVAMDAAVKTITPTGACTFNAGVGGTIGDLVTFSITTSGTSSFTLTWGTGFRKTGTLATGTTSARFFTVTFRCVAAGVWSEVGRTAVQT